MSTDYPPCFKTNQQTTRRPSRTILPLKEYFRVIINIAERGLGSIVLSKKSNHYNPEILLM
jgi:hypothetical protein